MLNFVLPLSVYLLMESLADRRFQPLVGKRAGTLKGAAVKIIGNENSEKQTPKIKKYSMKSTNSGCSDTFLCF